MEDASVPNTVSRSVLHAEVRRFRHQVDKCRAERVIGDAEKPTTKHRVRCENNAGWKPGDDRRQNKRCVLACEVVPNLKAGICAVAWRKNSGK